MVALPKLLYLQEPYRWLYEALPTPPWAANERPPGWWYDPPALAGELERAIRLRKRAVRSARKCGARPPLTRSCAIHCTLAESILRAYGLDAEVCYLGVGLAEPPVRVPPAAERTSSSPSVPPFPKRTSSSLFAPSAIGGTTPGRWSGSRMSPIMSSSDAYATSPPRLDVALDVRIAVPHEEVGDLYRRASLFLYAPRLEQLGLAPLEAAAAGFRWWPLPRQVPRNGERRCHRRPGVGGTTGLWRGRRCPGRQPGASAQLGAQGRQLVAERWGVADAGRRLEAALAATVRQARP